LTTTERGTLLHAVFDSVRAGLLMTTLTTWLALLPLVLGGLVSSALLNLLVVPALYLRFAKPPTETQSVR